MQHFDSIYFQYFYDFCAVTAMLGFWW